jgi:hypothetical protein
VTDDYLETMFIERFYDRHPEATEDEAKAAFKFWVKGVFERDVRRQGVTIR